MRPKPDFRFYRIGATFVSLVVILFMASGVTSCKDGDKKKDETEKKDTTKPVQPDTSGIKMIQGTYKLYQHLLTADQQRRLFANHIKQLNFHYIYKGRDADNNSIYILRVFGTDGTENSDDTEVDYIDLDTLPKTGRLFTNQEGFRQRLYRGDLKILYGSRFIRVNEPIEDSLYDDLTFIPNVLGDTVFYHATNDVKKVDLKTKKRTLGITYSKPSPPALPCENTPEGCEQ
jgi:hypothetical protein